MPAIQFAEYSGYFCLARKLLQDGQGSLSPVFRAGETAMIQQKSAIGLMVFTTLLGVAVTWLALI
jgi:hypothetical protein